MIRYFFSLFKTHFHIFFIVCFFSPILVGFVTGIIYYLITNPFSLENVVSTSDLLGAYSIYILMYPIKIIFQGFLSSLSLYIPFLAFIGSIIFFIASISTFFFLFQNFYILVFDKILNIVKSNKDFNGWFEIFFGLPFSLGILCIFLSFFIDGIFGLDDGDVLYDFFYSEYLSQIKIIQEYFGT